MQAEQNARIKERSYRPLRCLARPARCARCRCPAPPAPPAAGFCTGELAAWIPSCLMRLPAAPAPSPLPGVLAGAAAAGAAAPSGRTAWMRSGMGEAAGVTCRLAAGLLLALCSDATEDAQLAPSPGWEQADTASSSDAAAPATQSAASTAAAAASMAAATWLACPPRLLRLLVAPALPPALPLRSASADLRWAALSRRCCHSLSLACRRAPTSPSAGAGKMDTAAGCVPGPPTRASQLCGASNEDATNSLPACAHRRQRPPSRGSALRCLWGCAGGRAPAVQQQVAGVARAPRVLKPVPGGGQAGAAAAQKGLHCWAAQPARCSLHSLLPTCTVSSSER